MKRNEELELQIVSLQRQHDAQCAETAKQMDEKDAEMSDLQ